MELFMCPPLKLNACRNQSVDMRQTRKSQREGRRIPDRRFIQIWKVPCECSVRRAWPTGACDGRLYIYIYIYMYGSCRYFIITNN